MAAGATVFCRVADQSRGEFLHRMEYHADIHIVEGVHEVKFARWTYWLRSDRWGDALDGKEIQPITERGRPGFSFVPVFTSRK